MKRSSIVLVAVVIFGGWTGAQDQMPPRVSPDGQILADTARHPELAAAGDRYRFVLFADPQVGNQGDAATVGANARKTQLAAVEEINAMLPRPAFAVWLGDLVNVFTDSSGANFEDCIHAAKMTRVLVHGNHDGRPPYEKFRAMQKRVNGLEDLYYSFDAGRWHFIILPCNLEGPDGTAVEKSMLAWLDKDLERNRLRPTAVFLHLHLLPIGLTQLEWYTYPLELRRTLIDLLARHGNVRYCFNGHVHNGIQASVKTAWRYKGIRFVTVPTIIVGRSFGEEYPPFVEGLRKGGYYLLAEVAGETITLKGRLAGVEQEFVYPDNFRPFEDSIEPRWFRRTVDLPAGDRLDNGDFEAGLAGWQACFRYLADRDPAFVAEARPAPQRDGRAAFVRTRSKGNPFWANDEMTGLYQIAAIPKGSSLVLSADYFLPERFVNGGGFIRVNLLRADQLAGLMLFHWGENEKQADFIPRSFGYEVYGRQHSWSFLRDLGREKKGLYVAMPDAPGRWHSLTANLPRLYDQAVGQPGAFAQLGADRAFLQIATWCNRDAGADSTACFDAIRWEDRPDTPSAIDGRPLTAGPECFQIDFAGDLIDRQAARNK